MNVSDSERSSAPGSPGLDWAAFAEAARRRPLLVLLGVALGLSGALGVLSRSEPVYRAEATVVLEKSEHSDGVLGDLALLTSAPAAAAEIAVLQSRTLAEATVAAPQGRALPHYEEATSAPHLDLGTRVEDHSRRALEGLVARVLGRAVPSGRLRARMRAEQEQAPESLELEFLAADRVRLETEIPESDEAIAAFVPGVPFSFAGLALTLEPVGDVVGKRFTLVRQSQADAVRRLMGRTRVVETQRNSGVLAVTVSDSDPLRAAAAANAICANYFDQVVTKGRGRASTTVDFIKQQLERQQGELERVEMAVVELRRKHPDLIDLPAAAQGLAKDLSELELQHLRMSVEQQALSEAARLFGERRFEALSRLTEQLSDPLSQALIEQLTTLDMQRMTIGIGNDQPARLALQTRVDGLADQAAELGLEIAALDGLIQRLEAGDASAAALLSDSSAGGVTADPLSKSYLMRIADGRAERDRLAAELTPAHPRYQRAVLNLEHLDAQFLANLKSRSSGLRELYQARLELADQAQGGLDSAPQAQLAVIEAALQEVEQRTSVHLQQRAGALGESLGELDRFSDQLEARLAALPGVEQELAAPLRQLETHKELTSFLLRSLQEAEIKRAASTPSATFIDPAQAPVLRYAPRVGLTLVFGSALGLAAGLLSAFARERLRGALYSDKQLEQVTGLPILATIPDFRHGRARVRGASKEFIAMRDAPHGPVAEAYRSLRANLRFASADGEAPRTLAVTSCAPSEGKSTTNVDLAWAFASGGKKVLLVDADMRRPSVHRYLGRTLGAGLAESLASSHDWRPLVQSTGNPDLSVLMAGHLEGGAGEALTGPRAAELIEAWKSEYDLVVFDLPPALVVADVEAFAHSLDAIVLLYRAGGLPSAAVETACVRLRQSGSNLVGAVMNAYRHERRSGADYGAYGGYGQSEYYLKAPQENLRRVG